MPAKRNVTSHISFHTWSRSHEALPNFRWKRNHTCPQDDNKNANQAYILCSLTNEVFQKHTFFRIKHLRPQSPKRPVAEMS